MYVECFFFTLINTTFINIAAKSIKNYILFFQGDESEGSPLLCNINDKWYVLGISSQKITCPSSNKRRRFHHTFDHVQWIRHTLESLKGH